MSAHPLGYEVGDTVYVFDRSTYVIGRVTKITPTGLIDVDHPKWRLPQRFRADGHQQGKSDGWNWSFLDSKNGQVARKQAIDIRQRPDRFVNRCAALSRKHLGVDREAILAELRSLIAFVEETP